MPDQRDLTPEQEARVARLLAEARAEEPTPPEVAARLEQVLEGLAREHVPGPDEQYTPPVDLAARRRRRVRTLLVAAAAVVVAGVGIGQVVGPDGDDDNGDSATSADRPNDAAGDDDQNGAAEQAPESSQDRMSDAEKRALGEPAKITTRSFAADVRRLQDRPGVRNYTEDGLLFDHDLTAPDVDFPCGPAVYGDGKLLAVQYNGSPAVLAYRPPAGETQVVDLLQCGSGDVIRSTTIPLP